MRSNSALLTHALLLGRACAAKPRTLAGSRLEFSPPNLAVYICRHVFEKSRPILLIVREGEDWQFMCGGSDHGGEGDCKVVGVGHLIDRDPTINECADLPDGFEAERKSVGKRWIRTPIAAAAS
jgi:hypothetical protein